MQKERKNYIKRKPQLGLIKQVDDSFWWLKNNAHSDNSLVR